MDQQDKELLQKVFETSTRTDTSVREMKERLFGQTGNNGVIGDQEKRIRGLETQHAKQAGAMAVLVVAWEFVWHKVIGR